MLNDGRDWAHVPLESVLTSLILGLVCRLGSLNQGSRYDLRIWDEEDFTSWEGVHGSLRCLKVEEVRHSLRDGRPVTEENTGYIVTTCPKALVKPLTVWRIMHARWDIENKVFHEAKTYCSLDHCFIHHEVAAGVMWMLQVIALNLFLLFK